MPNDIQKAYCDCSYTANVSSVLVQSVLRLLYQFLVSLAIRPCQVGLAKWRKVDVIHEHLTVDASRSQLQTANEVNRTKVTFEQIYCGRCGIVECRNMRIYNNTKA